MSFAHRLIAWQRQSGRHDLPWQNTRDPYRIWLSEIMLQQTQVSSVIGYYQRFLARFPDVRALAGAPVEDVLQHWAGLGYYARARNLHRCAQVIVAEHGGRFPQTPETLAELPGIGRSTAAAIAAFAYGTRAAILDGNVKRVLCRHAGVEGHPGQLAVERRLWTLAENLLPETGIEAYTQGLMDLGATLCTRSKPSCQACPLADDCIARQSGRQTELPTPRPRKAVPDRQSTFLLIDDGRCLLLERRPAQGIWGGLLVPPEGPPDRVLPALSLRTLSVTALPPVQHTFTHFRLHIEALHLRVAPAAGDTPAGHCWVPRGEAAEAGLPTPMRKLIRQVTSATD